VVSFIQTMIQASDPITFSVPRAVLADIVQLSAELTDRMHELLERNTDNKLGPTEKAELETLVRVAEFGQIVSLALQPQSIP
jgi:aromatic ring-cleaving dioxygenase